MNRRVLLLQTAACLLLASKQGVAGSTVSLRTPAHPVIFDRLIALLPRHRSTYLMGQAVLRECPSHQDMSLLTQQLTATLELPSCASQWPSYRELRRRFMLRTSQDFQKGRVMLVEGWMLAETESQVLSLAALARNQGSLA